jgi:2-phosphoglycerate kinase
MPERDWTVLFIGGMTTCGKSTLAEALGRHFEARVLEMDLYALVLTNALPDDANLAKQLFARKSVVSLPSEDQAEGLEQWAAFVSQAMEVVVADRLIAKQPSIIEGVWALPSLAARESYKTGQGIQPVAVPEPGECRALFLVDPDMEELKKRLEDRYGQGWLASNPGNAEMNHLYGLKVAADAAAFGLPVLECRPFDTLFDRALVALNSSQQHSGEPG